MSATTVDPHSPELKEAIRALQIALPAPVDRLEQDEEWVVVKVGDAWRQIDINDYASVYSIQGLHEKWIYDVFGCRSPMKIRELLQHGLEAEGVDPADLTVLDLGAGNGCVAEELARIGVKRFVGVDIVPEAAEAADRDRPGLYADYVVDDLTSPSDETRRRLGEHRFTCMTCVAALGYCGIDPAVFAEAFNLVENGGWIAFTIEIDFLDESDTSGFSTLIRRLMAENLLELVVRENYLHRIGTDGRELRYEAFIGRKRADIPADGPRH